MDALQPRGQPQQIETEHIPLPLVRGVVLGVERRQLLEIRNTLLGRQRFLRACGGERKEYQREGRPDSTSHGVASSIRVKGKRGAADRTPTRAAASRKSDPRR